MKTKPTLPPCSLHCGWRYSHPPKAERVSLALAIFPDFGTCLECFEYLKAAQSFSIDCRILLPKLDLEHERFIIWGETHGISESACLEESLNGELNYSRILNLVKGALGLIESLFKNSNKLQDTWGLKAVEIA